MKLDASQFLIRINQAKNMVLLKARSGEERAADELLRLSQLEVPLDKSILQGSGHTGSDEKGAYVAYGGPAADYAVRLHEHPEYTFQNGRKGKYLEDPLKQNRSVFDRLIGEEIKEAL